MKKRIYAFITAFVLLVSITSASVSADVCLISNCTGQVYTVHDGDSQIRFDSHSYGGVLGLFTKTCYYNYYYSYYSGRCTYGHAVYSYNNRVETGHDCN